MATPAQAMAAARAAKVAELAAAARAANPTGWGSVDAGAPSASLPQPGTAHDPAPHASVWDRLADGKDALPGVTFRDAVGHHYASRPGGLNRVLVKSQEAMDKQGVPFPIWDDHFQYGRWSLRDVDTPMPVRLDPELQKIGAGGIWRNNAIGINPLTAGADGPRSGRNATLEHEATHGLTLSPLSRRGLTPSWSAPYQHMPFDSEFFGDGITGNEYLMRRSEIDPRLAEIRRRFASLEGRDVNTPADARDAWDWWKENQQQFNLGGEQPMTTLYPSAFALYDSLPESSKSILFRRMTQIPAIAAPIAAGAATQEQPSVLDGLRSK